MLVLVNVFQEQPLDEALTGLIHLRWGRWSRRGPRGREEILIAAKVRLGGAFLMRALALSRSRKVKRRNCGSSSSIHTTQHETFAVI